MYNITQTSPYTVQVQPCWLLTSGMCESRLLKGSTKKLVSFFKKYFLNKEGGSSIPKLYVKFWWPLFLAIKFKFLLQNLAKIHIFIPKCTEGGGLLV